MLLRALRELPHRLAPALLSALALAAPARAAGEDLPPYAARAGDTLVTWGELDRVLLDRFALSQTGRGALLHLLKGRVIEHLGREAGIEVPERRVDERVSELARELRLSGQATSLAEYLKQERVEEALFRHYLRLAIVQETLARRALGIPDSRPITGEQQEMWLEGVMSELGIEDHEPPWKDGVVTRCGPVRVSLADFAVHLRGRLGEEELREACFMLLLEKRLRARMPDLAEAAIERAATEEVRRRAKEIESDPKYQGVSYAQLLASQGIRAEAYPRDPTVRVAALARLWTERSYKAEERRRVYEDEREHFDGLYGEAVETWAIFLKAGRFKNELLPRTYEDAEKVLETLRARARTAAEFRALAAQHSEDPGSREREGLVGWVTRAGEERHLALKNAIFGALDAGSFDPTLPPDSRARMLGPVRTSRGCVLFWLGRLRPAPAWEIMSQHVTAELRRRFVDAALTPGEVRSFLDRE